MTIPTTPRAAKPSTIAARRTATILAVTAVVFFGAIFGFFFAWVCSTLWGLDTIDPRAAIEAMNAMNASVRNPVFFAAFFLTPAVALAAAGACVAAGARVPAVILGGAALLYGVGGILLTSNYNLPLNDALAVGGIPATVEEARAIWSAYSEQWQVYNLVRTIVSGICLALAAAAVFLLGSARPERSSSS